MTDSPLQAKPIKPPLRDFVEDVAMRGVSTLGVGLNAVCGSRAAGRFGILMYHRVADAVRGIPHPSISVSPAQFAQQVGGLLEQGYSIWPLQRLLKCRAAGEPIPPRVTAITFDDGFMGIYQHVAPVLRKHQITATVFLNTAFLGQEAPFPFDHWGMTHQAQVPAAAYRPLTEDQCLELDAEGLIEFGAHTHTHQDFRGRPDDLRVDVQTNLEQLTRLFGGRKFTFALPFGTPSLGYASEEMIQAVKSTGVTCCLNTEAVLNDSTRDAFHWGRFNVFPWDSGRTLAGKLSGWYSWAPQAKLRVSSALKRKPQPAMAPPVANCTEVAAHQMAKRTPSSVTHTKSSALPNPAISVVVPTYNRAHWLPEAIRSLAKQDLPPGVQHEIIICDNASSDNTRDVVQEVAKELRDVVEVRYLLQTKRGDGPTRNCGVQQSDSPWIAFFDDDQLATPNWLASLWNAAQTSGAKLVGGPVHLHLPDEKLDELGIHCRRALREIRFYDRLQPYEPKDLPGTGNALVSREVFDDVGIFAEDMINGGSDIDFFVRSREAGYAIWYSPDAIIRHRVSDERLSPSYFRWDAVSGGADHAAYFDYEKRGKLGLVTMCVVRLAHALICNVPRYLAAKLRRKNGHALGYRTLLWRTEGYIRRTLAIVSPRWFPQEEFFASLDFRQGREIEAEESSPQDAPGTAETTSPELVAAGEEVTG